MGENIFSKSIPLLVLLSTLLAQHTLGQIVDNFEDGDFSNNPAWSGDILNFGVVGAQLQLNAPDPTPSNTGTSVLTLPFAIPNNATTQWTFFIQHVTFSGSDNNNSRVYLMSSSGGLTGSTNGYYLQFGESGTEDAVRLFRQTGLSSTQVLAGAPQQIKDPFQLWVRVIRSSLGQWELLVGADINSLVSAGVAVDNTFSTSAYFGIRCKYTQTNVQHFNFDDFLVVSVPDPDVTPPQINSVTAINSSTVQLNFSEALNANEPLVFSNFILNDTVQITAASYTDTHDGVTLTLDQPMLNGYVQRITFPSFVDEVGNILQQGTHEFLFFQEVTPQANDIVLTEIYPDPSPSLGLPLQEFIELYNQSEHPFQLQNWQVTDGTTTGTVTTDFIFLPKRYVILSSLEGTLSYAPYGTSISASPFPSLNNSGDNLKLKSPDGTIIDSLTYTMAAYRDDDKSNGGYTLERIDPTNFCRGIENWKASGNVIGGSPGTENSVHEVTTDQTGPALSAVEAKAANAVALKFNERLAAAAPAEEDFIFPYPVDVLSATFSDEQHAAIDLVFSSDLDSATFYNIVVTNIFDCTGNPIQQDSSSATFKMDVVKPRVISVNAPTHDRIEIIFSEAVIEQSFNPQAIVIADYAGAMTFYLASGQKKLMIDLSTPLENGRDYLMIVQNIIDRFNNALDSSAYNIRFFEAKPVLPRDVVINEFFADPNPVIGLPESEFIEIHNRSANAIDVSGWRFTDGASQAVFPEKIILPGQYLILCAQTATPSYQSFGTTLGLANFPSLNNSGDLVKLMSEEGVVIDSIVYQSVWYHDDDKKDGGWSVERVNPNDFCRDAENWKASIDESGGTPGRVNSVFALTLDNRPPLILSFDPIDADSLVLNFSERLSIDAASADNIVFESPLAADTLAFTDDTMKSIGIRLEREMDSLATYRVTLRNIADCPGNVMNSDSTLLIKLDSSLPLVESVVTASQSSVRVAFSKKINVSAVTQSNFSILGHQLTEIKALDPYALQLIYGDPFVNGKEYRLIVSNVPDLAGNLSDTTTHSVLFFEPFPVSPKDIVISEIFADPTPTIGLPETEFVEIFNRSMHPIQLKNWTLHDERTAVKLKPHILLPSDRLVLTIASKSHQFQNSLGVSSFPMLTNAGESLSLKDSTGQTIDSLRYTDQWYRDSEKADGGWSLELIDPDNLCAEGENWTASEDPSGGTPGEVNSVDAEKPDLTAPEIISVFASAADTIIVTLNEKMNSETPPLNSFSFEPPVSIDHIDFTDQSKRAYFLKLSPPLEAGLRYAITIKSLADCAGNLIAPRQPMYFALPETPEPSDVIVNEILFNPSTTGVDFVELYNRSEKFINLRKWRIANMMNDTILNQKEISQADVIFEPGDFLVLTSDPNVVKGEYMQSVEDKMLRTQLPPLSDDEGSVVILDEQKKIIDTVFYSDKQHSPLLKNTEAVSLERVDINSPSSNENNWQSASATSGYATPGFQNGSAMQHVLEEAISVQPEIFAPTSSQGFTMIGYHLDQSGYVVNVKIVDAHGRVVKDVAENELLAAEGFFIWRGDTSSGSKAAIGAYLVWFEAFDQNGNVITVKKRVVIADRF
ncbi:MAG TPA: lamin tail domain-containing protein [Chryseosolibacter sp.]